MQVNIHEAKTHFSRLIERARAGEEIVIAKAGTPVAKLVALDEKPPPRRLFGGWEGMIIDPDWDSPEVNEEIAKPFYESEIFPEDDG